MVRLVHVGLVHLLVRLEGPCGKSSIFYTWSPRQKVDFPRNGMSDCSSLTGYAHNFLRYGPVIRAGNPVDSANYRARRV